MNTITERAQLAKTRRSISSKGGPEHERRAALAVIDVRLDKLDDELSGVDRRRAITATVRAATVLVANAVRTSNALTIEANALLVQNALDRLLRDDPDAHLYRAAFALLDASEAQLARPAKRKRKSPKRSKLDQLDAILDRLAPHLGGDD